MSRQNIPLLRFLTFFWDSLAFLTLSEQLKSAKECGISCLPYACCVKILRDQKNLHLELSLGENYCVKLVMGLNFHSANGHKNYQDNYDGILSIKLHFII